MRRSPHLPPLNAGYAEDSQFSGMVDEKTSVRSKTTSSPNLGKIRF
jgi:hypothetical protein